MQAPSLAALRMALLVGLSAVVFLALFVVSWLVYMPVMALVATPFTLLASLLVGASPNAALNSIAAVALSGGLSLATVTVVFRVLVRRARARRGRSPRPRSVLPAAAGPVR